MRRIGAIGAGMFLIVGIAALVVVAVMHALGVGQDPNAGVKTANACAAAWQASPEDAAGLPYWRWAILQPVDSPCYMDLMTVP